MQDTGLLVDWRKMVMTTVVMVMMTIILMMLMVLYCGRNPPQSGSHAQIV